MCRINHLFTSDSYYKECLSLLDEKYNEISEFTEDKGLDEDYDDENIDSLLEQEEYNINNQYEIQYNIWLNYNNM
ncbi:hypothetical protein RhiirC2_786848 [Rhizophagus irregularis]|uniref:Uncharacterized protein n=1 Tax=Rhizophagus irregularis TaxID=588596 RepID=A0A2N1MTJ1_9GLOM|nr:hypothetical protein RhiirC2_786848 [Rhizophagus irregularis]